jgi:hypothetical protein
MILDDAREGSPDASSDPEDEVPPVGDPAFSVTRPGDMWLIGCHCLVCGDSRFAEPLRVLLGRGRSRSHLHRSPLQCSHRRTCLRAWTYPPSRICVSRSWVLLVNRTGRSQPACLYFNTLRTRRRANSARKSPILGQWDNASDSLLTASQVGGVFGSDRRGTEKISPDS